MKFRKFAAYAFMASAMLMASCSSEEKKVEEKVEKPLVKVETVVSQSVDQIGNYTATTEADVVNNITTAMPNRIKAIYVDEGQKVSKGQRLVALDDVNTDSYELQVANAEANLKNVEINYNRAVELYKIGGGTKQSVEQMELSLINAQNALASAKRALQNVKENTVLTSPISGVVTARNYDAGDMTGQLPILTIAQVQPVKIVINVSESELAKVNNGMPAVVKFDTYGDEEFAGKVTMVAPTVDVATRTFGVEVTVANKDNRILPGMFARVELNLGTMEHVVVPDKAVVKQPGSGNYYVYVYKDGKVSYNQVQLGQRMGDKYELISGVESGSQVVVSGQSRLANGDAVELAK
ncbi:MAG: efflux RND transporter periplasmic adaptor subunit [Muribaculaceae bacterium]|jgi:RND family efflux transporter MFP subunit|nr:efflux RND transporter periplasmic adaptor subunit [Muribaculaceae bacterium]MBQ2440184.1 efflux RND transporter periplasmic adaptor subunit [Muribaculaceae bacterium]MBR4886892.1 efflux RND transporter periplasmic adaptor subunit [Muribaculaceae bacterium]MBR5787621.1 efflux RND transporter periplasmic adaptor subunit [Muribaculaceae bacterium]MEE1365761.1 efflux RND transporter periplasmic adaptor subunit [Muribaculaceae bacterium]